MTSGFKFPTQGCMFASIPMILALWHRHLVFQRRMTSFKGYNNGPFCITGMISPDYQGEVKLLLHNGSLQFNSVTQLCPILCDPMELSMPGLPVHHQLPESTQTHVHESVMPSSHLILCRPLLLASIFPSIRVFSNESPLHIRWSKYWSFSFNISPSNELSGLIFFRMDWLDFLASKGLLRIFSNTTDQKHQLFGTQLSL